MVDTLLKKGKIIPATEARITDTAGNIVKLDDLGYPIRGMEIKKIKPHAIPAIGKPKITDLQGRPIKIEEADLQPVQQAKKKK